jgi:hypothetical protein
VSTRRRPRPEDSAAAAREAVTLLPKLLACLEDHTVSAAVVALGFTLGAIAREASLSDASELLKVIETAAACELQIGQESQP